ncbi:MAG: MBL fold metallo-hydrolase [Saprospiraceae bacterium]|nr:MBL fold metallo-hydrolase [Saprospiraceae bacterium]
MSKLKIQFCGAAQAVTGSSHLITLENGKKILLDCGLYQGNDDDMKDFNENWYFNPADIDFLILSHAHIDHTGRVPKLVKDGFEGRILSTHATRDLCAIMLMDSAYLQQRDAKYENKWRVKQGKEPIEPLYQEGDVTKAMSMFVSIGYDRWYPVTEGVWVQYRDSGHILGSASITLRIQTSEGEKVLGFTGDIGRPERPILRDPKPMPQCDYILCESTYGNRLHEQRDEELNKFLQIIKETCIDKAGKLIIPAFSVGRTQEIVYMLDQLSNQKKLPPIPVYVDSPLAINATEIFRMHPDCFDKELTHYMMTDPNPWGFNNLHYVKEVEDSKKLNHMNQACIIISASGMITGGRIKHHVFNNIEKHNTTILIVGYAAPYTIGGQLRAGKDKIKMFGTEVDVNARVEIMDSFSAHGDYEEMIAFLSNQDKQRIKRLFLVHGELDTQKAFKEHLQSEGYENIYIPGLEQIFNLD